MSVSQSSRYYTNHLIIIHKHRFTWSDEPCVNMQAYVTRIVTQIFFRFGSRRWSSRKLHPLHPLHSLDLLPSCIRLNHVPRTDKPRRRSLYSFIREINCRPQRICGPQGIEIRSWGSGFFVEGSRYSCQGRRRYTWTEGAECSYRTKFREVRLLFPLVMEAYRSPKITKDGVTVAKSIVLQDKFENLGARYAFLREAADLILDLFRMLRTRRMRLLEMGRRRRLFSRGLFSLNRSRMSLRDVRPWTSVEERKPLSTPL